MQRINPKRHRAPILEGKRETAAAQLIAELSSGFVRASVHEIDDEINRALERIGITLGLDRATIAEYRPDGFAFFSHGWTRDPSYRIVGMALDANALMPWSKLKTMAGETVVMSSIESLPPEAAIDCETFRIYGPKSNIMVPIRVGGVSLAAVGFGFLKREYSWPPKVVERLSQVAEIFGYAFDRKRATNEMNRLRDELTYVTRVTTMGELAAAVAHELNQPLAAILNNAEAIQGMLQSDTPDLVEVKAAIDDIIQDDVRAGDIIRRLRSLFQHEKLRKSRLDLGEVVTEIGRLLKSDALIRNVSFKLEVEQSPTVLADRVQLQQAIVNLVLNGFDAVADTETGTRAVAVQVAQAESGRAQILVRDSGKGIPQEMIQRIFDPFYTTKPTGMGMGLAISRSIVEAHGGELCVSSILGTGSAFEISLPGEVAA